MKAFHNTDLAGVWIVENFFAADERGSFIKTFHAGQAAKMGFTGNFRESYYSHSVKNVIRGMHFQVPPADHEKLVYVTQGAILDVILDLRKEQATYGQFITVQLEGSGSSVLISKGLAHGFLTLSDTATVVYNVTSEYNAETDQGIRWDSFGFDWPVNNPVISARDCQFPTFKDFVSPF